ncbi:MAG: hypothetical protein ACLFVP_04470 [Candidatus Bathyarchaeia archaeon]
MISRFCLSGYLYFPWIDSFYAWHPVISFICGECARAGGRVMKGCFRRVECSPNLNALVLTLSDVRSEYGDDISEGEAVEILDASDPLISSMEAITAKAREKELFEISPCIMQAESAGKH